MQRQEREKESGVPVSCNWALGKLYELLPREKKSPGMNAESAALQGNIEAATLAIGDRKSTRLNSSHSQISYAVFCLKKKNIRIGLTVQQRTDYLSNWYWP